MKQTAVEWFAEKIGHNSLMGSAEYYEILEQAKAMEKEQIMQSLNDGKAMALGNKENESLEQYYKETYESNT